MAASVGLSAGAVEFHPGSVGRTGLTASAQIFVPSGPPDFVPGSCAWDGCGSAAVACDGGAWVDGTNGHTSWAPYAAATEPFAFAGVVSASGADINNGAGGTAAGGNCWFNADAFMSDDSSRPSDDGSDVASEAGEEAVSASPSAGRGPGGPNTPDDVGRVAASAAVAKSTATGSTAAVPVTEMSERTIKEWLRQFAYDGDAEWLCCQWRKWTSDGGAEAAEAARRKAVDWLLQCGLDDCCDAPTVVSALRHLLDEEASLAPVVKGAMEQYSDEDLADIALDNPMVSKFVESVNSLLAALVVAAAPKGAGETEDRADASEQAPALAAGEPAAGQSCIYSRRLLLAARPLVAPVADDALSGDAAGQVRWRCVAAPNAPATPQPPTPAKNRHGASTPKSLTSPSRDWREARAGGTTPARGERPALAAPSSTSWAAQVRRARAARKSSGSEGDNDAQEDANMLRELRGLLNKLTVDKFETLSDRIVSSISESTRPNSGVPMLMQLIFEKATTQHHFIAMYVDLCVKVHKWFMSSGTASSSEGNFKRILLNQCQSSFERYLDPPENLDGLIGEELYEAQVKYKTKMLGNIRLVGALISRGMLVSKIAIAVAEALVRDDPEVREERLETLAVFLEAVGPALDDATWTHHAALQSIFAELARLTKRADISCRIRCLLRDVLDMRRDGWRDGRPRTLTTEAPKKLAEVHSQAASQAEGGVRRALAAAGSASASAPWRVGAKGGAKAAAVPCTPKGSAAAAGAGKPLAPASPAAAPALAAEDIKRKLVEFHKELASVVRQVGSGALVASAAAERLNTFKPLPTGAAEEEAPDVLARLVDEPEQARRRLLPLLTALADGGVLSGRDLWARAVESFAEDALADPEDLDPPNLVDILLAELLPALKLRPAALRLPGCCRPANGAGAGRRCNAP